MCWSPCRPAGNSTSQSQQWWKWQWCQRSRHGDQSRSSRVLWKPLHTGGDISNRYIGWMVNIVVNTYTHLKLYNADKMLTCYWLQVITLKAKISTHETWVSWQRDTKYLLSQACRVAVGLWELVTEYLALLKSITALLFCQNKPKILKNNKMPWAKLLHCKRK